MLAIKGQVLSDFKHSLGEYMDSKEIAEGRAEGFARRISYYEALVRKQWPWFRRFWNFVMRKPSGDALDQTRILPQTYLVSSFCCLYHKCVS